MDAVLLAHDSGGWWWGGGFFLLFLGVIATLLIMKLLVFRGWSRRGWPDTTPDAILRRRLAGGEITEADYERISALIQGPPPARG